ncbi:MAG: hypothetical protein KC492_24600 [Myxococcales bacterium]|nr:hypothetical protein [Myxococcales bacterium]
MSDATKPDCPQCGRALLNRLFDRCQYCSAQLPPELCLSEAAKGVLRAKAKAETEAELERHRAKKQAEAEAEDAARRDESWPPPGFPFPGG